MAFNNPKYGSHFNLIGFVIPSYGIDLMVAVACTNEKKFFSPAPVKIKLETPFGAKTTLFPPAPDMTGIWKYFPSSVFIGWDQNDMW